MEQQEQYTASMQIMAAQRNAALDQVVMAQLQVTMLQDQVQKLTQQLEEANQKLAAPQAVANS